MFRSNHGVNNEDLLAFNRAVILRYLQRRGTCSRSELAKECGLTQASVSKIVSTLIDYRILREVGNITGDMGRRATGVELNGELFKSIGIKISRRSCSIGVFDLGGTLYDEHTIQYFPGQDIKPVIAELRRFAAEYAKNIPNIIAIGIAAPGPYLRKTGKIAVLTEMASWENYSLPDEFDDIAGIPVFIEHDANSAAIAEWLFSNYKQDRGTLAYMLVDEGVGAGVVVDGQILYGSQGIAGEIGHVSLDVNGPRCRCGNRGCLEAYCSSLAFVQNVRLHLAHDKDSILHSYAPEEITADCVFEAANAGDIFSQKQVELAATYMGYGVVNLINCYDPDTVVIGNTMSHGGERVLSTIQKVVEDRVRPSIHKNVHIRFPEIKADPVLYGSAAIAIDRFLNDPTAFIDKTPISEAKGQ